MRERMQPMDSISYSLGGEHMSGISRGKAAGNASASRQRLERFLRNSPDRYRDFFDNAIDPIFITDTNMNYVEVNRRAVEAFGYTCEEWLRMSVHDVIPPEQRERSEEEVSKLIREGAYERFEGQMVAKPYRLGDLAAVVRSCLDAL